MAARTAALARHQTAVDTDNNIDRGSGTLAGNAPATKWQAEKAKLNLEMAQLLESNQGLDDADVHLAAMDDARQSMSRDPHDPYGRAAMTAASQGLTQFGQEWSRRPKTPSAPAMPRL
jgi:hypothetical protein